MGRRQRDAIVAARLATLDSICAITNGRTRGEQLVALADQWIDDARVVDAYFRVLDGIPDARVRADVVTHALSASRSPLTREHARTIIEGLPSRLLRDAMTDHLAQADAGTATPAVRPPDRARSERVADTRRPADALLLQFPSPLLFFASSAPSASSR